jgi:hypothetical protein
MSEVKVDVNRVVYPASGTWEHIAIIKLLHLDCLYSYTYLISIFSGVCLDGCNGSRSISTISTSAEGTVRDAGGRQGVSIGTLSELKKSP